MQGNIFITYKNTTSSWCVFGSRYLLQVDNCEQSDMFQVKSFVKIFPRCKHGWTVRYNENDPSEVEAAMEAHKDMLAWLIDYLKWELETV